MHCFCTRRNHLTLMPTLPQGFCSGLRNVGCSAASSSSSSSSSQVVSRRAYRTVAHSFKSSHVPVSAVPVPRSPQETHRLQYLRARRRRRQKWGCELNRLHGSEQEGFGDPGVMDAVELVLMAEKALAQKLGNPILWSQMLERMRELKDIARIHDLVRCLHVPHLFSGISLFTST